MNSLKAYTLTLARHLGMSPNALYERQRELVRHGLLDVGRKRGPGGGVRTTQESIALLTLSAMASESLVDTARKTKAVADAQIIETTSGTFVGYRTLLQAFSRVLVQQSLASKATLTISRTAPRATLVLRGSHSPFRPEEMFAFGEIAEETAGISVVAILSNTTLKAIARDVRDLLNMSFDDQAAEDE